MNNAAGSSFVLEPMIIMPLLRLMFVKVGNETCAFKEILCVDRWLIITTQVSSSVFIATGEMSFH